MPLDWSLMGWVVLVVGLAAGAALIGRLTARLLIRASGSRVTRHRA